MNTWYLIGCSAKKASTPQTPDLLYQGPLFVQPFKYCEKIYKPEEGDRIFVLSAKHGLLHLRPNLSYMEVIEPYSFDLTRANKSTLRKWGGMVAIQLDQYISKYQIPYPLKLVFYAHRHYRDALKPFIEELQISVEVPLLGVVRGKQVKYWKHKLNDMFEGESKESWRDHPVMLTQKGGAYIKSDYKPQIEGNFMKALSEMKLQKKSNTVNSKGGYFGVRAIDQFPAKFMEYINSCDSFTDVTAGSGLFPRYLASLGKKVNISDRSYYSYLMLRTLSRNLSFTGSYEDWLKDTYGQIKGILETPFTGYLCNNEILSKKFSLETAKFIDSYCRFYQSNVLMLYALGKVFSTKFSFRGLGWCNKTTAGYKSNEVTPSTMAEWIIRTANLIMLRLTELDERFSVPDIFYGDVLQALDSFKVKDGMVYADPAWPWSEKFPGTNPYIWQTYDISSILTQTKIPEVRFWQREDTIDSILEEIKGWGDRAFERGAKYFVVCNQDTNYPSCEEVFDWFSKKFNTVEIIYNYEDYSSAAGRKYTTGWGIYTKE
jgi:hypothetical protein